MISFDAVSFAYRASGQPVVALEDVSMSLAPAEMLAVLGSNGSGKSTLVQLANALLLPETGSVHVDGMSTDDPRSTRAIRSRVGVVFQRPDDQIVATSVEDEVAFGPENLGVRRAEIRERVDESLAAVGLSGHEAREPHLLSGGQKQRLAIAGALAMRPAYLALDEPTSMLDPRGAAEVLAVVESLRVQGVGVLLVTHDLAEALRADRIVVLAGGVVRFSGRPEALLACGEQQLDEWGIEIPPVTRLVSALRDGGIALPIQTVKPEPIAVAVCR